MTSMKVVKVLNEHGPAENLYLSQCPIPKPGPGQALVKVYAFGISQIDIIQRSNKYPLPASVSPILGQEFSGVIVELGSDAAEVPTHSIRSKGLNVGEYVLGLVPGGAYAEYVVCDYRTLLVKPPGLSITEAAAIPVVWYTAVRAVKYDGAFQKRGKALVKDAELPVGRAMVKLLQLLGCRRVYCVGKNLKESELRLLGALIDEVILLEDLDVEKVKKWDPKGLQLVIDSRGYNSESNFQVLAPGQHMVLLGYQPSLSTNLFDAVMRHLHIHGTMIRGLSPEEQAPLRNFIDDHVLWRFANGRMDVQMDALFPLEHIQRAHNWAQEHPEQKVVVSVVEQPFEA